MSANLWRNNVQPLTVAYDPIIYEGLLEQVAGVVNETQHCTVWEPFFLFALNKQSYLRRGVYRITHAECTPTREDGKRAPGTLSFTVTLDVLTAGEGG